MTTNMNKILLALGLFTTALAITACDPDPVTPGTDTGGTDSGVPEDGGEEADTGGSGDPRCTVYCSQLMTNCTGANAQYDDMAECLAYCDAIDWPAGEVDDTGGNTLECRIYHGGAPAASGAAEHCPHAGPTGGGVCGAALTFRTEVAGMYDSVDRMGMPAVATALIPSASRNTYNDASPDDDASLMFAGDLLGSLTAIHEGLDDDLAAAGVAPCSMVDTVAVPGLGDLPECAGQEVAPGVPVVALVVPDTLRINPSAAAGFPNGRMLPDPVIDVTLAVILLDLSSTTGCASGPCTPGTLAGLPLNPAANDVAFSTTFPYLAAAHELP